MTKHERIWEAVRLVPYGRVATYGQIADAAGLDGHARLVGYALHALPNTAKVPWHRIINAAGRISLPGLSGRRQRRLLEAEGIQFTKAGKIDLKRYRM